MSPKQLNMAGFKHFVGVDGSEGMLEMARSSGLYQELKQSILGTEPIPVQSGRTETLQFVSVIDQKMHRVLRCSFARLF